LLAGGLISACLCLVVAVSIVLVVGRDSIPLLDRLAAEDQPLPEEVDPVAAQRLEESVIEIESAFRAGDVETALTWTHPAVRDAYRPIFQEHQGELERVADLLATRRLLHVTGTIAEYEVTENGRSFIVVFEAWGERWYLSAM
jgi:hypothetical protein